MSTKADGGEVRRHNLGIVLDAVAPGVVTSRAEVAAATGLTKATVSSLVADLVAAGILEHGADPRPPGAGRPATPVRRRALAVTGLGVEITARHGRVAEVDLAGSVVDHPAVDLTPAATTSPAATVAALAGPIAEAVRARVGAGGAVAGVAVAVPGLVAPGGREVVVAPTLGWEDVGLADLLETEIGRQLDAHGIAAPAVEVANEANDAALAEFRRGVGHDGGVRSMLYLSVGTGVGAGIVIDGEVFAGAHGFGGELGHMIVVPGGTRCSCGKRGCLETVIGGATDPAAAITSEAVEALAVALATAVDLFDPEVVVLGGRLQVHAAALTAAVQAAIDQRALGARWVGYRVEAGVLGPRAAVLGAADRALDAVRLDPRRSPLLTAAP